MTKKICVTVSSVKGFCAAGHKPGDRTTIGGPDGLSIDGYICPTAMHSLYPLIYGFKHGAVVNGGTSLKWSCPDAANAVVFEVVASDD